MFGKALGNGYAITSVIGRSSVMEAAQNSFISSTFWTERIGPTAGLKTLEIMEEKSWEVVTETGKKLRKLWQELADKHELKIKHNGLPALASLFRRRKSVRVQDIYYTGDVEKRILGIK